MVLRSMLFAPANSERRAYKALMGAADAAILDLEDAVAVAEKPAARRDALRWLSEPRSAHPAAYVRINGLATPFAFDDLREVVVPGLSGIVLPKTEARDDVVVADWLITQLERARGLPAGSVDLVPIIESAVGMERAAEIARAVPRVRRIMFGAGDFTLDAGMSWVPGLEGILIPRVQLVIVSRAAGLEPPIDTVFADLTNHEYFAEEAAQARRLGFQGKACIHPTQVDIVHSAFTPSPTEVGEARRIIEEFEQAEAAGMASIRVNGRFVDYPIAERARRVLALAEASRASRIAVPAASDGAYDPERRDPER